MAYTSTATAKPDGYTIGILNAPSFQAIPLSRKTQYTTEDFKLIGNIVYQENLLVANPGGKYVNIDDVIKTAKENPDTITLGHSGLYADDHLASLALQDAVGIKLVDTAFQGSAPSLVALMGNHIDLVVCNTIDIIAKYQEKQIVILASFGEERNPLYPEVPTLKELGYNTVMGTYMTIGVSKNTPDEVVAILRNGLEATFKDDEFLAAAKAADIPIAYFSPQEITERFSVLNSTLEAMWTKLRLPSAGN
jgi:tripartite-type tricarboxylate transporter receptor subunit TctC